MLTIFILAFKSKTYFYETTLAIMHIKAQKITTLEDFL